MKNRIKNEYNNKNKIKIKIKINGMTMKMYKQK